MSKPTRLMIIAALLATPGRAAAQSDQPPLRPAASRPASGQPTSLRATSQPITARPAAAKPPIRPPPADRVAKGSAGDDCRRDNDCQRGLRCDDRLCVPDLGKQSLVVPVKPSPREGGALQTRRGTMTVAGSLGFEYQTILRDRKDAISGVKLTFFPRYGLFIGDGLLLDFGLGIGGGFGELYESSPTSATFTVGLRYLFGSGRLRPYLGLSLGPEFLVPERGSPAIFFDVMVPAGLLIALNQHVALDLGLVFRAQIDAADKGFSTISLPFGLLGVQVFF